MNLMNDFEFVVTAVGLGFDLVKLLVMNAVYRTQDLKNSRRWIVNRIFGPDGLFLRFAESDFTFCNTQRFTFCTNLQRSW